MASEIEQLSDLVGFVKLATQPAWLKAQLPIIDFPKRAEAFVPAPRQ